MCRNDVHIIYTNDIPQGTEALYIREINTIVLENSISKLEQSKALKKIKEFLRSVNAKTL